MERKVWHKVSDKEYPDFKRTFLYIHENLFTIQSGVLLKYLNKDITPEQLCDDMYCWAYLDELLPKEMLNELKELNPDAKL